MFNCKEDGIEYCSMKDYIGVKLLERFIYKWKPLVGETYKVKVDNYTFDYKVNNTYVDYGKLKAKKRIKLTADFIQLQTALKNLGADIQAQAEEFILKYAVKSSLYLREEVILDNKLQVTDVENLSKWIDVIFSLSKKAWNYEDISKEFKTIKAVAEMKAEST